MKNWTFFFTCFFAPSVMAASIQTASNLQGDRVVLATTTADQRQLVQVELDTMERKLIAWPAAVEQEEVMGLFLLPDRLLLLAQWTAGDGKFPKIHQFLFTDRKWSLVGELPCISFDKVELKASLFVVQCAADSIHESEAGPVAMALPTKANLKMTLPLANAKAGDYSYRLHGPLLSWDSVDFDSSKQKRKTFTAGQLSEGIH